MAISVINDSWQRLSFGVAAETWVTDGGAANANTDYFLCDGGSRSDALTKNDTVGWAFDIGSSTDVTGKVISTWLLVNIAGILRTYAAGGISIIWCPNGATWGAGNANNFEYYVGGADTYFGGWEKFFIDPTKTDTLGNTPTIAQLQTCRYIGCFFRVENVNVPGNVDNAFIDSIDLHDRQGLNIVGTSSDVFEDLYTIDTVDGTGNTSAGPIGIFTKENNVYVSNAKILFGNGTTQTDVTGIGSVIAFADPFYSGQSVNTTHPLAPSEPALEVGGLGYHISGNNTKVQFGQSNLVGGVTTITAGTQYELLMESTATGEFYASRFDQIGTYGGTGLSTTLRGTTYQGGGWDVTGDIIVPNSNYLFNTCQFNNCAQIEINDGVFRGGFITDFDAPITGAGATGCDDLGAIKMDQNEDMLETNFIGNIYAINFQESGNYPMNLFFQGNTDESGLVQPSNALNTIDLINCTPDAVTVQVQGGDTPQTGFNSNPNGGTIDVQAVKTLTLTGFKDGSELYMRDFTNGTVPGVDIVERFNEEKATGSYDYVYQDNGAEVDIFVLKATGDPQAADENERPYQWLSFRQFVLPDNSQNLLIQQILDRNYSN